MYGALPLSVGCVRICSSDEDGSRVRNDDTAAILEHPGIQ